MTVETAVDMKGAKSRSNNLNKVEKEKLTEKYNNKMSLDKIFKLQFKIKKFLKTARSKNKVRSRLIFFKLFLTKSH